MKKLLLYPLFAIICFSFFSVYSYDADEKPTQDNSSQSLSEGWVMKLTPDTEKFVNVFFQTENHGCIYKGTQPLKRTTDGGNTFGYSTVPPFVTINNHTYFSGSYLIMTAQQTLGTSWIAYMYKSTDMGLTWEIFHSLSSEFPPAYYNIYCLYKNVGYLTVMPAAAPNTFRTKNGFNGWSWIDVGGRTMAWQVSYIDTAVVYGICGDGIGRCTHWAPTFDLMKSGSYSKVCVVDSNNILAISKSRLLKSTNAGVNWDSTTFPVRLNSISFPDQNTGYMTGSSGKIFKSTDKGATWITQNAPTTDSLVDCCFLNAQTGYVIGYNGTLLKTNTGGVSTFSVSGFVRYSDNNQPVTSGKVKAFKLDRQTMNILYLDSANIQSDGSYTLANVPQDSVDIGVFPNSTPPNDWVITYYPSTIYWEHATVIYPTGNLTNINISALRMSAVSNNNSVNGRISGVSYNPVSNLKDAILYAKNGNTFVRCTMSDAGGVYHLQSLPAGNIKIIATRLGYKRDSTSVNVTVSSNTDSINFLLSRYTVGINQISSEVPSEFKLFQNYPNPFNPKTIIRYSIPGIGFRTGAFRNDKVVLKVYDILGKEIAALVNEIQSPGVYEVMFDASSLSSGIYFYRLQSENFSEIKRMVLLK